MNHCHSNQSRAYTRCNTYRKKTNTLLHHIISSTPSPPETNYSGILSNVVTTSHQDTVGSDDEFDQYIFGVGG